MIAILATIVISTPAIAKQHVTSRSALRHGAELFLQGDCAGAWKAIWPFARKGNAEALTILSMAMSFESLVPPTDKTSKPKSLTEHRISHMMTLALYGWRHTTPGQKAGEWAIEITSGDIPRFNKLYGRVNSCLKRHDDKSRCVKLAAEWNLIPAFNQYVAMVDKATEEAKCLPVDRPGSSITDIPLPARP